MKKKIVFVINYFYPDFASTGQIMTELCLALQDRFDITVIAAKPNDEQDLFKKALRSDRLEDINIVRIRLPKQDKSSKWSRLQYVCSYFFLALFALMKQRSTDIIFTISTPPILGGMIGTIGKFLKRKCKHVYNIQDFNPEQAEAIAYWKKPWIFGAARMLDNLNCRYADHVVTVGRDMEETLLARLKGTDVPAHSVIHNWTDENDIVPLSKQHPEVDRFLRHHGLEDKFIVMYSGNLGLYYDLENIIALTSQFLDEPNLVFLFVGEGVVSRRMKDYVQQHQISNVKFLPFQPKDSIKYSLNAADIHLVVNQKGIKGVSVPSKIYGVMAAGKPILGVLELGSEAERLIRESCSGVVVEPQQYDEIARSIRDLFRSSSDGLRVMGLNGRAYLESHLRKQLSIQKYEKLIQGM